MRFLYTINSNNAIVVDKIIAVNLAKIQDESTGKKEIIGYSVAIETDIKAFIIYLKDVEKYKGADLVYTNIEQAKALHKALIVALANQKKDGPDIIYVEDIIEEVNKQFESAEADEMIKKTRELS